MQKCKGFCEGIKSPDWRKCKTRSWSEFFFFLITKGDLRCVLGKIGKVLAVVWLWGGLSGRTLWTTLCWMQLLAASSTCNAEPIPGISGTFVKKCLRKGGKCCEKETTPLEEEEKDRGNHTRAGGERRFGRSGEMLEQNRILRRGRRKKSYLSKGREEEAWLWRVSSWWRNPLWGNWVQSKESKKKSSYHLLTPVSCTSPHLPKRAECSPQKGDWRPERGEKRFTELSWGVFL